MGIGVLFRNILSRRAEKGDFDSNASSLLAIGVINLPRQRRTISLA
jgi:hypothetical protein